MGDLIEEDEFTKSMKRLGLLKPVKYVKGETIKVGKVKVHIEAHYEDVPNPEKQEVKKDIENNRKINRLVELLGKYVKDKEVFRKFLEEQEVLTIKIFYTAFIG